MQASRPVTQTFEAVDRGVRPVTWSADLEECAKEYYAFAKETDACPEMGDTVDVTNAIKRYAKFMMLQFRHADILLVPPFDVKVVWLAHMIRVEMYRKDCEAAFGRVIDSYVLEPKFRTRASLPQTQELWKSAWGADLKFEYQPGARRVNIPQKALDGKNFMPSVAVKDVIADRKWLPLLESSLRNFSFTDTMVANAKKAYDMYMYLLYKEPNCDLGPPASVDLIWHAHMCNPARYDIDCNRLLGKVILHSPWPAEGGTVERVETMFAREYGAAMSEVVAGLAEISVNAVPQREVKPTIIPPQPMMPSPPCGIRLPLPQHPIPPPLEPPRMCSRPPPPMMCRRAPNHPPLLSKLQQAMKDGACTFAVTGETFLQQAYYQCITCNYGPNDGFCASCLIKCHKGHNVTVSVNMECYCDCGAGKAPGSCCQAMDRSGKYGSQQFPLVTPA